MRSNLSKSAIGRIAAVEAMRAHQDYGLDVTQRIDPFVALSIAGVVAMRQPLEGLAGAYLPAVANATAPGVLINANHPLSKQNFTAAHELAHHRRDREFVIDTETELFRRLGSQATERERIAEAFASWFLMPPTLIQQLLARRADVHASLTSQEVYELALEMGTSYLATIHHLGTLGILDRQQEAQLATVAPATIKRALFGELPLPDPRRDVRQVTLSKEPVRLTAIEGDSLLVHVEEMPSTGFRWRMDDSFDGAELLAERFTSNSPSVVGAPGIHTFVLQMTAASDPEIQFDLVRPWLATQIIDTRRLRLSVNLPPSAGLLDPTVLLAAAA